MTKKYLKNFWFGHAKSLLFNGKSRMRIVVVAMGLPLALALADICMNWVVNEAIKNLNILFTNWMWFRLLL